MKSLVNYIKEELYSTDNIEYPIYQDIYLYLNQSHSMLDRLQAISDKFRKQYNNNLSVDVLKNSKIFIKFIDDLISEYSNNVKTVKMNVGTKTHLMNIIASKLIQKIRMEQDIPEPEE